MIEVNKFYYYIESHFASHDIVNCVQCLRAENAQLRHDLQAAMDKIAVMAQHLGRLAEKGVRVEAVL
jgi:hypothetical protein